jgi:hypothetical protein
MSERIAGLNGTARAEKHDCADEQVFHDGLLVVVTQKDDGFDALRHGTDYGASAYRADFKPKRRVFNRNG